MTFDGSSFTAEGDLGDTLSFMVAILSPTSVQVPICLRPNEYVKNADELRNE